MIADYVKFIKNLIYHPKKTANIFSERILDGIWMYLGEWIILLTDDVQIADLWLHRVGIDLQRSLQEISWLQSPQPFLVAAILTWHIYLGREERKHNLVVSQSISTSFLPSFIRFPNVF